MNEIKWFESQSGNRPNLGCFAAGDWYADIVVPYKDRERRISGRGKTPIEAIAALRLRLESGEHLRS